MVDILLPDVRVAKITPSLVDNTGRFTSPLSGAVKTVSRPGDRWAFRLDYSNLQGLDRARLESTIANLRGAANRLLYSPGDYVQRGSFPSTELFANGNFKNGAANWGVENAESFLTVTDRVAKLLPLANDGHQIGFFQSVMNMTVYAPHVMRALVEDGCQSAGLQINTYIEGATESFALGGTNRGLNTVTLVPSSIGSNQFPAVIESGQVYTAGAYVLVPWTSLSRCMLVDNGPNLLSYSDDGTQAAWTQNGATVTFGAFAADSTATASRLLETATNGTHYTIHSATTVASTAVDFAFSAVLIAGTRSWAFIEIIENAGGTGVSCFFNLGSGTLGTITVGANWANARAFISSMGNGYYLCTIVMRKTNAATSIQAIIGSATADTTSSYLGTANANAINYWRATLAQSSVPTRLVQSGSSPVAAAAQVGSALYVKGLPASTSGQLLPGDWIEVNKELKRVTASLDSDAAGRGYLQFSPPLRNSPADNDPVITNMPMGRFITKSSESGWSSSPPYFATSSIDLIEAPQ